MSVGAFTIKAVGEWDKQVGVPLQTALRVIIENTKKTGEQAVANCIVMMAQAARKMTPKAKANRKVLKGGASGKLDYIEVYQQGVGGAPGKLGKVWKYQFSPRASANFRLNGTWEQAKRVENSGMAQRSWFWGLRGLPGAPMTGRPYKGVAKLLTLRGTGDMVTGMIRENRIAFMTRILPPGYEAQIVRSVGNKVMGQYAKKIEREAARDLERQVKQVAGIVKGLL
jgi:hypothetical protein